MMNNYKELAYNDAPSKTNTTNSNIIIPVYKPYLTSLEKKYVNECLDSSWISSKGEFIKRFEDNFANYIGAEFATSVCNGTVAIHLALEALGIKAGDEVIVPSLTYVASVNTIVQTRATPVFVDSSSTTWQIDPDDVRKKITPKTKAIMAVHLYGFPCDMDALTKICEENNLFLIEDCAEAFGTYYNQQHVGTFGDVATFSFFGNKTITTGEGGMVVAKKKSIIERALHLKTQGVSREREYWHDTLAYNYRMTNICAAIGCAQLEKADAILAKKRKIAEWYQKGLDGLALDTPYEAPNIKSSYWMYSIATKTAKERESLREHLKQNGIETRPVFYPTHTLPHLKTSGMFSAADSLSARGINLPSYPELKKNEIDLICGNIHAHLNRFN